MTKRASEAAPSTRRDLQWLLVAVSVIGTLAAAGALVHASERDRRQAAIRGLTARVATSAALTDSVFKALGTTSSARISQRYGGSKLAEMLRGDARRNPAAGASAPIFSAVADSTGRVLAGVGSAPRRIRLAAGAVGEARLSSVLPADDEEAVQFIIPFYAGDGSRRSLVRGVAVPVMQAFLTDFLAGLPNPDGARLTLSDGGEVILAERRDRSVDRRQAVAMLASSTRVPGTPWRLTLAAPRDRVLAGVNSHRWVPWLLLTALGAAGLAGVGLARRLELAASRARRTSAELAASREELQSLIGALDEGVAHRDADGAIHLLNDSARRHVGTDLAVIDPSRPPGQLLDEDGKVLEPDAYPGAQASQGRVVSGRIVGFEADDGARRWLRLSARPLTGDGAPAPHPVVMSFTDVTAQRELELHLTRLAEHDPLTGLMNRRRFEGDLATQLARCRRYGERSALVLLDVDQFKAINDSLGHLAGDEVLRTIAVTVQSRLRAGDVAGRLGGDEFALLLVDADEAQARAIASELACRIRGAVRSGLDGVDVTVTFGVAELHAASGSAEAVLDASDRDMYANKPQRAEASRAQHAPLPVADVDSDRPQALAALFATVRACDAYTASHSRDVVALSRAVAIRLGLDAATRSEVEHVALIHDLGKIAIPDAILRKPGTLNADEQSLMRQHPVIGAQIVGSVNALQHLATAVRAEHERWDGGGYPDGLAGDEIPVASRIVFVCDAYHAMTTDRLYRSAMPTGDALAELERHAGTQFCPSAVTALLRVLATRTGAGRDTADALPATDGRRALTADSFS